MDSYINKHKYIFVFVVMFLFSFLTVPKMLNHIPWSDEAHAYVLAQFMRPDNFINILRSEGHPILWFLIIMPFAKSQFAYPYPMLIINWLCWFSALLVMWFKAPFNNLLKIIITFSSASLIYFAIIARGYSLGLLLLFIIASLYKRQLKNPVLYAVLLAVSFHINLFTGIVGSGFGIIFIFNLIKSKSKDLIGVSVILLSSVLLFIAPYFSDYREALRFSHTIPMTKRFLMFFTKSSFYIYAVSYLGILYYVIKKCDIKAKFLLLYIITLNIIIFSFIYRGYEHHYLLFFFYPVISIWISENPQQWQKCDFVYILFLLLFMFPLNNQLRYCYKQDKPDLLSFVKAINSADELKGQRIYIKNKMKIYSLIPYLSKDIEVYEMCYTRKIDEKTNVYCDENNWQLEDIFKEVDSFYFITDDVLIGSIKQIMHYDNLRLYMIKKDYNK